MAMRLSVRWKKDRKLQFRLALFTGGRSEISLYVLAYNLKRMMTIWGTEGLTVKLREQSN
ncbi:hypothetical protein CMR97_24445 [Salmonella enterica]|uniref:Uncharacterized protein n=1 Tax=Salmonella enterica TaxID=28901 RepID=A0A5T3EM53_SALER|nr:hypothetical protein [Salmonella enterica subsp. enterica serovar Javiana]EAN2043937.1 hypothetical protein [Salmonella enterica]EBC2494098.1 hypothetical protein [Salmonella enterica subsp. enterica serovar Newport]EBP7487666.1 hypothetical protein [Salmonella enterica subsp. enterica]ECN4998629.1 hypothetical protein [Salmonella enterica subsp. enterica serovar Montevideo]